MLETSSLHHTEVQIVPFTGNKTLSPLIQRSPTFLSPGTGFMEDNFSMDPGDGDGLGMIQAHYIYCILYVYYYYISSTSDHQALDPGGWGPLP